MIRPGLTVGGGTDARLAPRSPRRASAPERTYRVAMGLGRTALRALDLRITGHGVEHVPTSGQVLLAATHVSYPDFVFVQEAYVLAQAVGRRRGGLRLPRGRDLLLLHGALADARGRQPGPRDRGAGRAGAPPAARG